MKVKCCECGNDAVILPDGTLHCEHCFPSKRVDNRREKSVSINQKGKTMRTTKQKIKYLIYTYAQAVMWIIVALMQLILPFPASLVSLIYLGLGILAMRDTYKVEQTKLLKELNRHRQLKVKFLEANNNE